MTGGGQRGSRPVLALALLAAPILLLGLGTPGFQEDEGRFAEVAREMLLTGDWITPRLDFTLFLNKPPLTYWLTALTFTVVGPGEHARVWTALLGIALLGVVCRLGRGGAGPRTGLLAGLVLLTTAGFFFEARTMRPDLPITLAVAVSLLAVLRAHAATTPRPRTRWMCVAAGCLALSVMAKGLVAPVLAGAIVVVTLFLCGQLGFLARVRWWAPLAVALAVLLPWHVCAGLRHEGFWWDYVVNQHLLFFFDRKLPRDSLPAPLSVFWAAFLARTLPWGVFLPAAVVHAVSSARAGRTPGTLLPLVWLVVVLGFFSASPARLEHYSVPALPAVALLVGRWWTEAVEAGRWRGAAFGAAALALLATVGLLLGPGLVRAQGWAAAPALARIAVVSFAMLLAGTAATALALWRGHARAAFALLVLTMLPQFPCIHRGMAMTDTFSSWKPVAERLAQVLGDDVEVVYAAAGEYQSCGGLIFYSGTPLTILLPDGFVAPPYLDTRREQRFIDRPEFLRRWTSDRPVLVVVDPERSEDDVVPRSALLLGQWGDRRMQGNRAFAERHGGSRGVAGGTGPPP